MRNRIKPLVTAVLISAVTLLSAVITPSASAETMTTSETAIAMLKDYEGFRSHVYWDNGLAFIGYGTNCQSWDYPDGISVDTADQLLREALKTKEDAVNKVLTKYNVRLTQNQFDAIMSFTYNLGTGWMNSGTRLYNYLINGTSNYSDIQIVNAFGTWCHEGKAVNNKLVQRRIHEAKIFLYGDYAGTDPRQYKYLTFDAGSGEVENSIAFFYYGAAYGTIQTATLSGKYFAGWVTDNGTTITASTIVQSNLNVSAVWSDSPVAVQKTSFPDVAETDWFYPYVKDLSSSGIISGMPDGTFKPGNTITTGEALKLIIRAVGFDPQPAVDSNWASGYLKLAVAKGFVTQGEIADLNAPITRLQIAQITAKALGLPPIDPETIFTDTTDGYVLALYHCNIVSGSGAAGSILYKPQDTMTRAEISAIIWRIGESNAVPY